MTIGIIGGGQLARMIALAGIPLGFKFVFLDPSSDACASSCGVLLCGEYDDEELLLKISKMCDVVTYEFENVPSETIKFLEGKIPVFPNSNSLTVSRDRFLEKSHFNKLAIKTADYKCVECLSELEEALEHIGFPAVLKTRTLGYDGKGQILINKEGDLSSVWQSFEGKKCVLEGYVNFDFEVSIIAARSVSGKTCFYPLSKNEHRKGILRTSVVFQNEVLQKKAEKIATELLNSLDYVGVLAIEFFVIKEDLIVNEFAPRVHNSGHWTIDGAVTSQFENHVRAIIDLPLGCTCLIGYSGMVNFIGDIPKTPDLLSIKSLHLHLYDKDPRKGRKVGHANICCKNESDFSDRLKEAQKLADETDNS